MGNPESGRYWHSDLSYLKRPSKASLLHALELPPSGGDTMLAGMYAAYDALSPAMKGMLEGLTAVHDLRTRGPDVFHGRSEPGADGENARRSSIRSSGPIRKRAERRCSSIRASRRTSSSWPERRATPCSGCCSPTPRSRNSSTVTGGGYATS